MGGRVEGKKKKKSIKANVTSKFNSKRKLSRMGKKVQKGKAGASTEFITRSSALRRLQITLKDFRRLCILKGIYPRVPNKALKGKDKVYYDIKDISYIAHEPLLHKFREFKAFMKKIRRAAGRNQIADARSKNELKPKITLNHLVKERYPRFIDALRDLDDPLCMVHLFANLPTQGRITPEHVKTCSTLCKEWQQYVMQSQALRKVFVSVKGIYYQAEVMGEMITWLVPHQFTQSLPREVDFRVMLTFLEFYEVLLKFTLFKLYHSQGWSYPPVLEDGAVAAGEQASLHATAEAAAAPAPAPSKSKKQKVDEKLQAKVSALLEDMDEGDGDDLGDGDEEEMGAALTSPLYSALGGVEGQGELERRTFDVAASGRLFSGLVFFLNREIPRAALVLCIVSFGGKVGWQGSGSSILEDDARITHHIIDRPLVSAAHKTREYVQPQWVFDSINAQVLLPVRGYGVGVALPPHLSPFVDDEREGYVPEYRKVIDKIKGGGNAASELVASTNTNEKDEEVEEEEQDSDDDNDDSDEDEEGSDQDSDEEQDEGNSEEDGSAESEAETVEEEPQTHSKKGPKAIVYKTNNPKLSEAAEQRTLQYNMMGKKNKRLYDRMQYGIQEKQKQNELLMKKRKVLEEAQSAGDASDKTVKNKNKGEQKASKKQKKA